MKTQESFGEYTRRIYRLPDMDQRPREKKAVFSGPPFHRG